MLKEPQAQVLHRESWKNYFLLSFRSSPLARDSHPGQFVMVRTSDGFYPLLRRPFSIHSREDDALEIFFQVTGIGTALLAQKKPGDSLDILGPLGRGFSLDLAAGPGTAYLVGGGRGIAPLYFLARELRAKNSPHKIKILYGGKTADDLPLRDRWQREDFLLACSTDDGSFGFKGLVTDLLQEELRKTNPSCIYACGPEAMMNKTAALAAALRVPAEFSLESVMGCGFGACWGCVKRTRKNGRDAWHKVCEEGPIFAREQIIWSGEEE